MNIIHHTINRKFNDVIECYFSDDNANKLIFRIRLIEDDDSKLDTSDNIIKTEVLSFFELETSHIDAKNVSNIEQKT